MFLRFFIACTAISICVRAHPSRLKILPGLAFYRTDDGHDDSDNALMDKDKDLLKSMWNIVDKMDNKNHPAPGPSMFSTSGGGGGGHEDGVPGRGGPRGPGGVPFAKGAPGHPVVPGPPGAHGAHGRPAPLGTPITTINVYSTYPGAAAVKGETPFTATTTYHHVPVNQYQGGSNFGGATPFSANSDIGARNRDNRFNQNVIPNSSPNFDTPKSQRAFDSYVPPQNNQMPFEPPPPPPQDSMISQSQYENLMNPNGGMGQPFDGQLENSDNMGRGMFDSNQGDEMGQGYGGSEIENPAGSAPLHFLMSHMNPNGPMRPMEDLIHESHMNYQSMGVDPLRSHLMY